MRSIWATPVKVGGRDYLVNYYGSYPLNKRDRARRWMEQHEENIACSIGMVAIAAFLLTAALMWGAGVI